MKIAIINDADPRSGVGKYGYKLAEELSENFEETESDLIQKQYYQKPTYQADSYIQGVKLPFLNRTVNDVLGLFSFSDRDREDYDVVHFNTLKGVNPKEGDFVTVHDLMPIKIPENYSKYHRWRFKKNLEKTEGCNVICISEETKKDFKEWKTFPVKNIFVIPNGVDTEVYRDRPKEESKEYFGLKEDKKYLLHVGSDEKRKNLPFLSDLLEKLPEEYTLIRIGPEVKELPKSKKRIIYLDDLTEKEMSKAYNASDYLLLPSTYEGFGRPVIEALACKTQVIKSRKNLPNFESAIELELEIESWKETIISQKEEKIAEFDHSWKSVVNRLKEVYSNEV
ncbi:MAG: glycosyltransferase [Candidatus Nanohaloarchaea archaeon]